MKYIVPKPPQVNMSIRRIGIRFVDAGIRIRANCHFGTLPWLCVKCCSLMLLDFYRQQRACLRWRPYRVECTGSLLTSEVKRRRARLVLGWGTAREDLRVLPALSLLQANKKRQCHCHCVVVFKLHGGLYCVVTPSDWFQRCCLRGLCFVLRPELQPAMLVALRASLPPSSP